MSTINSNDTPSTIENKAGNAMNNAYEALKSQLEKLHTGRASPALLENIQITQSHGGTSRLNYISSITATDARTLRITPFDPADTSLIAKGLQQSELSLNPDVRKHEIFVILPPLTDQRRKDTVRLIHTATEEICEEIRNHRRTANNQCKALVKAKSISEDDEHRSYKKIQQLTDDAIARVKKVAQEKEDQIINH
jgi:ribosome recycling factor